MHARENPREKSTVVKIINSNIGPIQAEKTKSDIVYYL